MTISRIACLAELITEIQEAPDRQALVVRTSRSLGVFGFHNFNLSINARDKYGLLTPDLTTFESNFFNDFDRNGFVEIDPVLALSITVRHPFSWTSRRTPRDDRERKLIEFANSVPLARGMVIPLAHTSGRVSTANISSAHDVKFDDEVAKCVTILMRATMMKVESLGLCKDDALARLVDADLSAYQIEVLNWAAQGKSNADIATITGRSKRAVDYHMSEVLRKLKVSTRAQAIVLAAGQGHRPLP